jgi:glycerol uptake facilitator protein
LAGTTLSDGIIRIVGEFIGAFLGAVSVYLAYFQHWAETKDAGLKLAVHSTGPAIRGPMWNLITEISGTFLLIFVIVSIFGKLATPSGGGPVAGLGLYLVAMLFWGIGLSLGCPTGYSINPARDLGPRIAHAILPTASKGDGDWGCWSIPVGGPLIGAVPAALLKLAIGGM